MKEDLSIVERERFIECRYCDHLVSSENPVCSNCGLEMTSEGITELAKLDESTREESYSRIKRSYILMFIALMSLFFTIIGGLMSYWIENPAPFKFYFWLGLIVYFLMLVWFNFEPKKNPLHFSKNRFESAYLRTSLFFIFLSISFGIVTYIFLRN